MRILYLSPRQAWPANSGAKLRDYYFARALGERSHLTYVFFAEPGRDPDLSRWGFAARARSVPKPKGYTAGKILRGVFGRWPISVENYTSGDMNAAIQELAASGPAPDVIHLDALQLAGYTPLLGRLFPGVPVVYDWHNIESELMDRYAANTRSFARRLYASITARRLRALERTILSTAYGHVVCSRRERDQLVDAAPTARIEVIDNGVDTEFYGAVIPVAHPHRLLFVGSMAYHANIEASVWFAESVWPSIHARFPSMILTLAGYNPAPAVRALAQRPGIEVTGTVDDVRPFYAEAVAAIAPLRTAGGTRLKILEAMAARVPVLSTAIGAEGLDVEHDRDLLIAGAPEEWVAAVDRVQQPETRARLTAAGYDLVRGNYDWNRLGGRLCETYERWLKGERR
jgi:polysaccharide biosynthesis protein PslH